MVTPTTQKLFIAGIVLFFLAFVGYKLFTQSPADVSSDVASNPGTEINGQQILALVDRLKKINIDEAIFSSNSFNSLIDRTSPITPEQTGRTNPFALIGADVTALPPSGTRLATSTRP